jgi:hypothetical protein
LLGQAFEFSPVHITSQLLQSCPAKHLRTRPAIDGARWSLARRNRASWFCRSRSFTISSHAVPTVPHRNSHPSATLRHEKSLVGGIRGVGVPASQTAVGTATTADTSESASKQPEASPVRRSNTFECRRSDRKLRYDQRGISPFSKRSQVS